MHQDCVSCKDKRNCINGAFCMKCGSYMEYNCTKPCDYEDWSNCKKKENDESK